MSAPAKDGEGEIRGLVYRVPGPEDGQSIWIARSVTGQVAHGRTPEAAVERLRSGIQALMRATGDSPSHWREMHAQEHTRPVREGELLQT
jgi:hypothetical protein